MSSGGSWAIERGCERSMVPLSSRQQSLDLLEYLSAGCQHRLQQGRSSLKDYKVLEKVGQGCTGAVFKCVRKADGHVCAIKEVDISVLSEGQKRAAVEEARLLSSLDDPYVVAFQDAFLEHGSLYIVMEFLEGGTLLHRLKAQGNAELEEVAVWEYFLQIAVGLYHIHSRNIIHSDLKPMNVLLDSYGRAKVIDFSAAKLMASPSPGTHSSMGTPQYISPELLRGNACNTKVDVWALGCILYQLLTLRCPFSADNQGALAMRILDGHYEPPQQRSRELRGLVNLCLRPDPDSRPTTAQILASPPVFYMAKSLEIQIPPDLESLWSSIELQVRVPRNRRGSTRRSRFEDGISFQIAQTAEETEGVLHASDSGQWIVCRVPPVEHLPMPPPKPPRDALTRRCTSEPFRGRGCGPKTAPPAVVRHPEGRQYQPSMTAAAETDMSSPPFCMGQPSNLDFDPDCPDCYATAIAQGLPLPSTAKRRDEWESSAVMQTSNRAGAPEDFCPCILCCKLCNAEYQHMIRPPPMAAPLQRRPWARSKFSPALREEASPAPGTLNMPKGSGSADTGEGSLGSCKDERHTSVHGDGK